MTYSAPLADMRFVLDKIVGLREIAELPGCEAAQGDTVDAVLAEAGKLAGEVLAPLNRVGDLERSVVENGAVRTPKGFKEAYDLFVGGGWNGLMFDPEIGGQGLPWSVSTAITEMWESSNLAFSLLPMLTQAAVECLEKVGTPEQQKMYLPKLVSGEWAGTMNLTEPQAGSDVGALKTRAVRDGDHYLITGTKIFITYGEHDLADNIIHLVLARTPDAPPGTKGISLFVVPKFRVNADGSLGERNDLRVVSVEHKLGIHASPTCVMSYGDNGGAYAEIVGAECEGMRHMFIMMNIARLNVGLEGLGVGERAYQQALAYAKDRRQGRALEGGGDMVPIIRHPDVRRMLLLMKANNEAMRAATYLTAGAIDRARRHPDRNVREREQAFVDLMIPVIKGWCTDVGVEVASIGVQVHGGMGFVEETGAAQHYRDARIAPIYEGTNGIQALDLVMRKLPREGGSIARGVIDRMRATAVDVASIDDPAFASMRRHLADANAALGQATDWLLEALQRNPADAAAGATPYLRLFGTAFGGHMLARCALAARAALGDGEGDAAFLRGKIATARFYAEQVLPQALGLVGPATAGAAALAALDADAAA